MSPKDKSQNAVNKGSDGDLKVELVVNEKAEATIFYNMPFKKTPSWFEYDLDDSRLDFIMNDGDVRDFGVPVDPSLNKYLQNAFQILMVLKGDKEEEQSEGYLPLIIHRA
jgi:hypothetical protein